jgi:NAD(P)H dehydrogenase (quinone)
MLAECGVAWTSLRNGFYASSAMMQVEPAIKSDVIEIPEDGRVSWTSHSDLAEATAAILDNEGCFDGPPRR